MSTPLPGQIQCPTCHRSTPPAAFCTQCGTAIPDSARARPRGLDREELQGRIRTHRPGDAAFRRGSQVGGGEPAPSAYRPYQPEPEDELVLPGAAAEEGAAARIDNTAPGFDEAAPPIVTPPAAAAPPPTVTPAAVPPPPVVAQEPPSVAPPPSPIAASPPPPVASAPTAPRAPQPAPWKPAPAPLPAEPVQAAALSASVPQPPYQPPEPPDAYRYRDPEDEWNPRSSGMGPLAIGGFVLLGVLAIGVGAFMAGLFGGAPAASSSPSPLISTSPSASIGASLQPSIPSSAQASVPASIGPTPVGAGFTATTQPCAEQPASQDGCNSSGSTVTGGSLWVWVGWRKGSDADTIGVNIVDATGTNVGTGSIALSTIGSNGCGASCNGWARFKFGGLDPGDYTIRVDRNGDEVAQATFTVNP